MEYYANQNDYRSYLQHFGIQGMKWGVRRYQNPDGSLTEAGKKRYGVASSKKQFKKEYKEYKREKSKLRSEEYDRLYKKNGAAGLEKKLESDRYDPYYYGRARDRDKVRRERYELVDEYDKKEAEVFKASRKNAKIQLEKKYGKQRLSEFEAREARNRKIAAGAVLSTAAVVAGTAFLRSPKGRAVMAKTMSEIRPYGTRIDITKEVERMYPKMVTKAGWS